MASTFLTFTFLISISLSHLLINPSLAKHHSDHEDTENHHHHHHQHHSDHNGTEDHRHHQHQHHSDHNGTENHHHNQHHHHSDNNDTENHHHHQHHHHSDHNDTENHHHHYHHHHHSDHEDTKDHHHHQHHHSGHNTDEQEKPGRVKWTTQVLNQVCRKTQDYSFCRTLLSSKQTKKAEYVGQVAKISIRSALSYARETSNKIKSLAEGSDTDKKSGGYRSCSDKYDTIIRDLKEANRFLKSGDYRKVRDEARSAQEEVKGCKKEIGSADGSVSDRNNNLQNHCSIIAALANI